MAVPSRGADVSRRHMDGRFVGPVVDSAGIDTHGFGVWHKQHELQRGQFVGNEPGSIAAACDWEQADPAHSNNLCWFVSYMESIDLYMCMYS